MIKTLNIKLPYCFYFKKKLCLIYMDILVVSNIFNKFSKIFLDNNKTQLDIDVLTEFLEDPFNLDLDHLNYFYLQFGGAIPMDLASKGAEVAGKVAEKGAEAAKNAAGDAEGAAKNAAGAAVGAAKNAAGAAGGEENKDGEESKEGEDDNNEDEDEDEEEEEEATEEEPKKSYKQGAKDYFSSIMQEVGEPGSDTENSLLKLLNFLVKCLLYPLLFIFLIIFPYIYVTYTSFKKLLKSYRKNVLTV